MPALVLVAIQDDVTVSSVELAMKRLLHGNLIRTLDAPDLHTDTETRTDPARVSSLNSS